jgi:hypothetical protein
MFEDDRTKWAFQVLQLSPTASMADVLSTVYQTESCLSPDLICAREIVLALTRHRYSGDFSRHSSTHLIGEDGTNFQKLLVFVLKRLFEYGLKRRDDNCYVRVETHPNRPTIAWKRLCTIREFISREIRKDTEPEFWKMLTNPKDNLDILCRHLCENEQYFEFAPLPVNSMLISWRNGTYSIRDNVFWLDECSDDWSKLAQEAQSERRQMGQWGGDYTLSPPDVSISSINLIDQEFRLCDESNKNAIDSITDALTQVGIAPESHWWLFVLIGRIFFPLHKLDRWQIMPFVKTDESLDNSIITIFQDFFTTLLGCDAVALLSSGTNIHFALETIMKARVACIVMRDAPPIEQGDWQSATCAETVCINSNTRGKASFSSEWSTHLFAVGAKMPYKNDAATVERRVVMFDATNATVDAIDALRVLVRDNVDILLQTSVDAYLTAVHKYSKQSVWDDGILPSYLHRMRTKLREITNPLYSCLRSDLFEYHENNFIPLSDFKDLYQDYRRQRGLPAQRWIRDHWHATFQELKLTIERGSREYHGSKSTTEWVVGVDCITLPEERQSSMMLTEDTVEEIRIESIRCEQESKRLHSRYVAARTLLDIETQIQSLKENRRRARLDYHATNDAKHDA